MTERESVMHAADASACMAAMQPAEETVAVQAVNVAESLVIIGVAAAVALAMYLLAARTIFRFRRTDRFAQEVTDRCRWPGRITVTLLAVLAAVPVTDLPRTLSEEVVGRLQHGLTIAAIVTTTWLALRLALAIEATMLSSLDVEEIDDQFAQRRRTQVTLLRRVAAAAIILLSVGSVLMTFDTARSFGTSLLASAGVLAVVAGIAAQATIGNLIAGIQIAIAEPIKLDDIVVVEGEWGHIEEITLTFVVVRIWDHRRLVLPTSYFVQNPITNWTRNSTHLMGTVFWYLDHRVPIAAMRAEFHRQVLKHPRWDHDFSSLLVTEVTEDRVEVRGLVTAADAWDLWTLRCAIREGMLDWLVANHPESLPATRLLEAAPTPDRPPATPPQPPLPSPEPPSTPARPEPNRDPGRTQELQTPTWRSPTHRGRRPR